jgi:DNA replication and repair protein RecF
MVRKAIKQRNQALKQRASRQHIRLWETTCLESCEALSKYRKHYLTALTKILTRLLGKTFMSEHALSLRYDQGWPEDKMLPEAWEDSFLQDLRWGYTSIGPHQADLKVLSNKKPAKDVLSRGQQKLFVSMLKLAQGLLLTEKKHIFPIYLFDDLASELDDPHCKKIAKALADTPSQILMTSIEPPKALFEGAKRLTLMRS